MLQPLLFSGANSTQSKAGLNKSPHLLLEDSVVNTHLSPADVFVPTQHNQPEIKDSSRQESAEQKESCLPVAQSPRLKRKKSMEFHSKHPLGESSDGIQAESYRSALTKKLKRPSTELHYQAIQQERSRQEKMQLEEIEQKAKSLAETFSKEQLREKIGLLNFSLENLQQFLNAQLELGNITQKLDKLEKSIISSSVLNPLELHQLKELKGQKKSLAQFLASQGNYISLNQSELEKKKDVFLRGKSICEQAISINQLKEEAREAQKTDALVQDVIEAPKAARYNLDDEVIKKLRVKYSRERFKKAANKLYSDYKNSEKTPELRKKLSQELVLLARAELAAHRRHY